MRRLILLLIPFICGFQITEVMYNPEGNDNTREYVEIFLNGSSLPLAWVEDLRSSDLLTLVHEGINDYALLVEEGYDWNGTNATIYSVGATIGNGLNNDKDLVLLRDNSSLLDAVYYVAERDGGQNNGKSLCVARDVLQECMPTPGEENDLDKNIVEQNATLWISEFLPDPRGDDRAMRPNGEWIELYNYGDETVDLRGMLLQDARNTTLAISDVLVDDPLLAPESYGVVYLQGRTLLNNDGFESIRLLTSDEKVLDATSYSFSKEGLSWSREFMTNTFLLALPTPGEPYVPEIVSLNSSLVLERVYAGNDDLVHFGESFRARLLVRKGDTEKTTVKVSVLNLSKQVTVSVDEKFVNHTFILTIPLIPNCKESFSDGEYLVYAQGLDAEATIPVHIKGNSKDSCVILKENVTVQRLPVKEASVQQNVVSLITPNKEPSDTFINETEKIIYESSDYKARRWAVYFYCLTLVLLIAALLTRE